MIIYRTSGNYHKGIKEVEIESINNDGTFNYKYENRIIKKPFVPRYGKHQAHYFLTYKEAKVHLSKRINEKIKEFQDQIKKGRVALNAL